ncbi:MAG TPA: hypothetical protein VEC57_14905 [Candidatus Limnocylindrales bacterium]|nr:hypothetical protein [Candidatus Limnocylindrales bacterium]
MHAVTLVMPRTQARKAYLEYRKLVTRDRDAEDQRRRNEDAALMRAYREIARGNPVIDLPHTMRAAGLGADFYPKLAIGRADKAHCWVEMFAGGGAVFTGYDPGKYYRGRPAASTRAELPAGTFETWSTRWNNERNTAQYVNRPSDWSRKAKALTPTVPAELRPKASLERFCILWEAVWTREAPRDPMLLKPLGGPFYAVVAVWDLTELERAVLRGRIGE